MKHRRRIGRVVLISFLSITLSSCATMPMSVDSQQAVKQKPVDNPIGKVVISDFVLGAGDVLEFNVYRQKDLDTKTVVPPDGIIYLPLVGAVETRGLGIRQVRDRIIEGYSKYLVDPQVVVKVEAIKSQKAFVLGEVRNPGIITLDTHIDVIEAIARAGGPSLDGETRSVVLIRGNLEKPELISLNITKALNEGDLSQSVFLKSGDVIFVPRTFIADVDRFFFHFANIIRPIVNLKQGIALWPSVEGVLRGDYTSDLRRGGGTIVVPSP